jgi:hypothetical protein
VIAAGIGADDNWHRWAVFEIGSENAEAAADTSLLIPPSAANYRLLPCSGNTDGNQATPSISCYEIGTKNTLKAAACLVV